MQKLSNLNSKSTLQWFLERCMLMQINIPLFGASTSTKVVYFKIDERVIDNDPLPRFSFMRKAIKAIYKNAVLKQLIQ